MASAGEMKLACARSSIQLREDGSWAQLPIGLETLAVFRKQGIGGCASLADRADQQVSTRHHECIMRRVRRGCQSAIL